MAGFVMGSWFVSIACADYVAGLFSALVKTESVGETATGVEGLKAYSDVFTPIIWMAVTAGIVLFVCSRMVNKLMHGVR
jgi:POT family proton-dependent oligopeptide transporter